MGSVWLATATRMNAEVVVKFPHAALLSQKGFKQRFQNEIRSLINLSHKHPSIVKIIDVGEHQGTPYAVMQYLGGGSVRDWSSRLRASPNSGPMRSSSSSGISMNGSTPVRRQAGELLRTKPTSGGRRCWPSASICARNCGGWKKRLTRSTFVHRSALVHRDVKPQNILFDESHRAHLADFGITKLIDPPSAEMSLAVTSTSQIVGTMGYMAPEVLLGEKADGRADQYSLAVTFYEALSGHRPFKGETPGALCMQQQNSRPKSLVSHCPFLPRSMQAVVEKATP